MILVINICKEPLHQLEFVKPIEDILTSNEIKFFTKHYKKLSQQGLNRADKVIICGTSLKDNFFIRDAKEFFWLNGFKKPVLGICGGAHIIGIILKNKIKKDKEIGLKEINLNKDFLGLFGKKQVYHLHQFVSLPEVFHKENFYSTLFHPEVRNKEMILNFCNLS